MRYSLGGVSKMNSMERSVRGVLVALLALLFVVPSSGLAANAESEPLTRSGVGSALSEGSDGAPEMVRDVNTQQTAWRNTQDVTAPNGADRKPMLYQILGNNDKIDTNTDELRLDFMVRVAHGEVDPNKGDGTWGRDTGIGIYYDYGDYPTGEDYAHMINYIKTMGDASDAVGLTNLQLGAKRWADDQDEHFTILKVLHSGLYDYITMSVECDMNYIDAGSYPDWWASATSNGRKIMPRIYVIVGAHASWDASMNTQRLDAEPLATNVMAGRTATVYPGTCAGGGDRTGCDVPMSFIGYNTTPQLWSYGQSNWGLVTDHGVAVGAEEGVAPKDSFFVFWYNAAYSSDPNNPCNQVSAFKYQWIGLQNGNSWVPVDALTPTPQLVTGQPLAGMGPTPYTAQGGVTYSAAFNGKSNYFDSIYTTNNTNKLMVPNAGQPGVAQRADGSIDFKVAKKGQKDGKPLDGYFKLVTWPVATPGCKVTSPDDPHGPADPGITDGMAQDAVQKQLDLGWTIDSAYYGLDIARPQAPTIDQYRGYAAPSSRLITGTGVPGYTLTLYSEDPDHPMLTDDPKGDDTSGVLIGSVTVGADGKWSMVDHRALDPSTQPSVRYRAYQTQNAGFRMASRFSPIMSADFQRNFNTNPEIRLVSAPHTVLDTKTGETALPAGSKVSVAGGLTALHKDDTFSLYIVPQDGPSAGSANGSDGGSAAKTGGETDCPSSKPAPIGTSNDGIRVPDCKYRIPGSVKSVGKLAAVTDVPASSTSPASVAAQWSVDIPAADFLKVGSLYRNRTVFAVYAVLQDVDGGPPAIGVVYDQVIDMVPPTVDSLAVSQSEGLSGKVQSSVPVAAGALSGAGFDPIAKSTIDVTWPDGGLSSTVAKADGTWRLDVPAGMAAGPISIKAVDRAGALEMTHNIDTIHGSRDIKGNESDRFEIRLAAVPSASGLPFTGWRRWYLLAVAALVALGGVIGGMVLRRLREKLRGVSAEGPAHKRT